MAAPYLFLATPCHGGQVHIQYLHSVLQLQAACEARAIGCHVELLENDHLVARGRARLAATFLAHEAATHMLFVDEDIAFSPESVFRLIAADKDLVGGVCPLKHRDWNKVRALAKADAPDLEAASLGYVIRFLPNPANTVAVEDGLAQVAYAGTGFLLIRREVVRQVAEAHPELTATLDDGRRTAMMFEPMIEPETGQYLSEDYAFCRRWRDLGGEVWADLAARLTHVGQTAYTGSALTAMQPA